MSSPKSGHFSLAEIRRADAAAKDVERALCQGPGLEHSLSSLLVIANTLQSAMQHFTIDWIDKPVDELQALHNLSTNLAAAACDARDRVAMALGTVLDYRIEGSTNDELANAELDALCQDVTRVLQRMAHNAPPARARASVPTSSLDKLTEAAVPTTADVEMANEPVVADRSTGVYHAVGSPLIGRIAHFNRIAFVSAEAAQLSGFRHEEAPESATDDS